MQFLAASMCLSILTALSYAQIVRIPVVGDSFSISGKVSTSQNVALSGAKIYLKSRIYYILAKTTAPIDPYTIIVDSSETNISGVYSFSKKQSGSYILRFAKSGYITKDTAVDLTRDTVINIMLKPGIDPVPLKGTVSTMQCPANPFIDIPCLAKPVTGCTIIVQGRPSISDPVIYDPLIPIIEPFIYAKTLTDSQGNYSFPDIAMEAIEYVTVTAAAPGYLRQTVDTVIYSTKETTLNFSLAVAYENSASKLIDSVLYTFAVDKKTYAPGDSLRARYMVTNNKLTPIAMPWGPCDFDMTVTDTKGRQLYQFLFQRVCPLIYIEKKIAPGETAIWESYVPYCIPAGYDTLTVTGVPVAVAKAAVSVGIRIVPPTSAAQKSDFSACAALQLAGGNNRLVLTLDRNRTLTASGIRPNGTVESIFVNRRFSAGSHVITFDNYMSGVAVVRIEGEGFSKTWRMVSVR